MASSAKWREWERQLAREREIKEERRLRIAAAVEASAERRREGYARFAAGKGEADHAREVRLVPTYGKGRKPQPKPTKSKLWAKHRTPHKSPAKPGVRVQLGPIQATLKHTEPNGPRGPMVLEVEL